ncbi:DUF2617 family protein [Solwaraspora sp. WMMD1047]|uniref:DUF2617 family protein n=1 Tax=Solwaraspora sp. WMMD1047 TaxID=3016102 RepID=UPI002417DB95|nr:DUF2617 family protein [Solwaraspora sp. WMMD1047]MDG4834564.1 DUF2617 family protein [Solwaraspora sp. WMMD1047]
MLVTLVTPYADTSAADLGLTLTAPELPALHVVDLPLPGPGDEEGARLRLRLLGASHQVVLDGPAGELIETVACLPGRPADLPPVVYDAATGYRFAARVLRLAPAAFSDRIAALRRDLDGDPNALVGVFPGGPDAVTALRARTSGAGPDGTQRVGWHTWHAYPQTGELVETETVVTVR